ncbi:hypothetical protein AOLI_G00248280 [Acnodon oligacanthus]
MTGLSYGRVTVKLLQLQAARSSRSCHLFLPSVEKDQRGEGAAAEKEREGEGGRERDFRGEPEDAASLPKQDSEFSFSPNPPTSSPCARQHSDMQRHQLTRPSETCCHRTSR